MPTCFFISEVKIPLCSPCRAPKYTSVLNLLFIAICSVEKRHTTVNYSVLTLRGRLKPESLYFFTSHIIFLKKAVYYLTFICGEAEKFCGLSFLEEEDFYKSQFLKFLRLRNYVSPEKHGFIIHIVLRCWHNSLTDWDMRCPSLIFQPTVTAFAFSK